MGFDLKASARCDKCGNYLSSSSEECDHDGEEVNRQFFRRTVRGEPETMVVEATPPWKWYRLAQVMEEDWIAYEWCGTRSQVKSMIAEDMWDDVSDIPKIAMSVDAPSDVEEEVLE